ncbi:MAG: hypothetical protein KKC01_06695 [Gammaproteobacteria bacterium]|nr:hypothetical protein [Gammaproteobacteria bacterium]
MNNSSHYGSVVIFGSNSRRIALFCVLAILFAFNHLHARAEQPDADFLLDAADSASNLRTTSRWHNAHNDAVVSVHRVRLNTKALALPLSPLNELIDRKKFTPLIVGQTFRMRLPGISKPITLEVNQVAQFEPDVITYSGNITDDTEAYFSFSLQDSRLLGKLLIGQVSYVIEPVADVSGMHDIIVLDRGLLIRVDDSPAFDAEIAASQPIRSSTGSGDVRVLFLFANNVNNQALLAAQTVSEFNLALARSGVACANKISSAGVLTVASGFTGSHDCRGKILYDMHMRNAPFTAMNSWLNSHAADIAFLIVQTGSLSTPCPSGLGGFNVRARIGGVSTGFYPGTAGIQDHSQSPFSLSADTYALGDLTALHEIGHTLGGQHANESRPTAAQFTLGEYSHGIDGEVVSGSQTFEWQTIMGGYRTDDTNPFVAALRCKFDFSLTDPEMQPCERIPHFSNPVMSAQFNGQIISLGASVDTDMPGVANDQFKADMESWLEVSGMPIVSGYFADPPAPTSAPILNVQSEHCLGLNTVTWNSVNGANSYELFRSLSSGFSFPTKIFTGSSLITTVNVPQGQTWYLRVKACNSGGCSDLSNQEAAGSIPSCL